MNLENAQAQFIQIFHSLHGENRADFLVWLSNHYIKPHANSSASGTVNRSHNNPSQQCMDCEYDGAIDNADIFLDHISSDIRETIPVDALFTSEEIVCPTVGENADCDPNHTVHVDGFLYDEDAIDALCEEGKIDRNYCTKCGSRDVKPLTFITHSSSKGQLKYIFSHLLPDLHGKTVLDVGSRLGAVLYGAYHLSTASRIMGVEINKDLCQLQQQIIDKYKMADRIQVIYADICSQMELLQQADVVILQNVFEFFAPLDVQTRIWQFLHQSLRSSTILITNPGLKDSLQHLETHINVDKWVEEKDLSELQKTATAHIYQSDADVEEFDLETLHFYSVL